MIDANRRLNIADELAKAEREMAAGELLCATSPDIAVTRAYYAAFHVARALLLSEDQQPRTHAGVIHLVHQHFVRTGRLDPELAHDLTGLEADRVKADYDAAVVFTESMARRALQHAARFGAACRALLAGWIDP